MCEKSWSKYKKSMLYLVFVGIAERWVLHLFSLGFSHKLEKRSICDFQQEENRWRNKPSCNPPSIPEGSLYINDKHMEGRYLQQESAQRHPDSPSDPSHPNQNGTQSRDQTMESQGKADEEADEARAGKSKQTASKPEASDVPPYERTWNGHHQQSISVCCAKDRRKITTIVGYARHEPR